MVARDLVSHGEGLEDVRFSVQMLEDTKVNLARP